MSDSEGLVGAAATPAGQDLVDGFKRPLAAAPRRKRFRKTVLDEDNYIRELEGIVERDYFPDLKRLRAQDEYLAAVQCGDAPRQQELRARYGSGARPDTAQSWSTEAPAVPETPTPGGAVDRAEDEPAQPLSLNQYLATHTSEDNESFGEMMAEASRRHRVRHPWLYAAEAAHNDRQAALLSLDVPSLEEQADGGPRPGQVATWRYRSENDLMYAPRGLALTAEDKIERSRLRQEIDVANTRFKSTPFNEAEQRAEVGRAAQVQARRRLGGKVDVDGREVVEPAGRQLLRTPSPAPGVAESPLMTWGQIDGSPFRLDGGATPVAAPPASPFRIVAASRREQLALALAERASSRHRDKKGRALEAARRHVASPSAAALDRLASLSPAARRLARAGRSADRALRASYTP
ncbi:splicing factor ESS-2 homolog, partial [Pollicipes pollicipes]|uniref:splicing factor ESS-2 homolog n=1 Tax=Pollicipes pollicipes TaxID=41117 RepID=UPI00188561EF